MAVKKKTTPYSNVRFYDVGEHAGGFVGYRVFQANIKKSHYFSIKQLGKREAKKQAYALAEELQREYPTFAKIRSSRNNRRLLDIGLPAGIGIQIDVLHRIRDSGEAYWNFAPVFVVETYMNPKIDIKRFSIRLNGYEAAWEMAVNRFAKQRKLKRQEKEELLENIPDREAFMKLLRMKLKQYKDLDPKVDRKKFKGILQ
ncbi:hypothetical protein [Gynuella sp.]|uniref:hypothetical protein n=1 Tax=Gynuella sp. TaxID=2969146 RepID=UPI003D1420D1